MYHVFELRLEVSREQRQRRVTHEEDAKGQLALEFARRVPVVNDLIIRSLPPFVRVHGNVGAYAVEKGRVVRRHRLQHLYVYR